MEVADISDVGNVGTMWNWDHVGACGIGNSPGLDGYVRLCHFNPLWPEEESPFIQPPQLVLGHFLNQFWLDREFRIHTLLPGIAFVHVPMESWVPDVMASLAPPWSALKIWV